MRALHLVKTTDGAPWAAQQVAELVRLGAEIHVALPTANGLFMDAWHESGAKIHIVPLDFPITAPWKIPETCRAARKLVANVAPDLIHSHFVGTTVILRLALGRNHPIPRIFQVPGPLHLEHQIPRLIELSSASQNDYWICSSKCILRYYEEAGIAADRLFLSYWGCRQWEFSTERTGALREMLGISNDELVIGNISWMYPPKYHLGQTVGLKCHEDLIDALALVVQQRRDVVGVLIGGAYRGATWYEERLRKRALAVGNRLKLPGFIGHSLVRRAWADFDCAVHVPMSENCGGVVEPLLVGVPTIAGRIGGLPEVVIDGITGKTIPVRRPSVLANAVLEVLEDLERYRAMAQTGRDLVSTMFDIRRTSAEVYKIYRHLLNASEPAPAHFEPFVGSHLRPHACTARGVSNASL